MKTIHILVLIGALIFSSCSDLDEINENHNYPSNVPPQLLLTNIQKEAFKVEGLNPLYAMRMAILTSEENSYQYYKWGAGSFDDYTNLLQVTKMIEEAHRINNPNYLAVGKFFRAFYFYKLTLTFGDIPYTEALAGESQGIFTPKYDTQQSVLEGILKELEEANNLLNTSGSLSGDIIYNGNLLKWKKLINSFKLKILLSLSQKTTVGSINIIQEFNKITNSQPLISTNEDNAQLVFYDQAGSRYTQFNSSSYASSLYLSDYFINLFKNRNDPRIFSFAQQTVGASENGLSITDFNAYNGGNPIVPYAENEKLVAAKNISKINNRFYLDPVNEPHTVLSYSEMEFILAEASARGWISSDPKSHYENAIRASFEFYQGYVKNSYKYFQGFDISTYLSSPVVAYNSGSLNSQIQQILTQKYMIMFHQSGWTGYYDYLRTGYPELTQQTGVTPPYRWVYPNTEYNKNPIKLKEAVQRQFGGNDNIRSKPWWLQ